MQGTQVPIPLALVGKRSQVRGLAGRHTNPCNPPHSRHLMQQSYSHLALLSNSFLLLFPLLPTSIILICSLCFPATTNPFSFLSASLRYQPVTAFKTVVHQVVRHAFSLVGSTAASSIYALQAPRNNHRQFSFPFTTFFDTNLTTLLISQKTQS